MNCKINLNCQSKLNRSFANYSHHSFDLETTLKDFAQKAWKVFISSPLAIWLRRCLSLFLLENVCCTSSFVRFAPILAGFLLFRSLQLFLPSLILPLLAIELLRLVLRSIQ